MAGHVRPSFRCAGVSTVRLEAALYAARIASSNVGVLASGVTELVIDVARSLPINTDALVVGLIS